MGLAGSGHALRAYLNTFNTTYGTTATVLNNCTLCHIPPGQSVNNINNYALDYSNAGYSFPAIESLDSDGDGYSNIVEINARTFPGDPTSFPAAAGDTTPPTVTAFVIPATSSSLAVSITTFTASDNIAVTGYIITETSAIPAAGAAGWSATPPTSYTFASGGAKTLYAWAKDAAGNVSASASATVTITLPDTTPPTITAFTIPATATSLTVSITTFTATDAVGVTGYMVTESSAPPAAGAAGWTATAPVDFVFATAGAKTLYAWAKDAAGNVSAPASASVTITLPDTIPPTVTAFVLGQPSGMTVPITTFTAADNAGGAGVAGYMVTETSAVPSPILAQWAAVAPTSFTFSSGGNKTLYAWAKDAAGNVSNVLVTATVTITPPDTTPPTVTAFVIPATLQVQTITQGVAVPITTFTATDNIAVTGYLITESATAPDPGAPGWTVIAPTSYTVITAGQKTLYAWAKDASGNVSTSLNASVTIILPPIYNPTNPVPDGAINVSLTPTLTITVHFPSPDGHVQRSATWEVCTDNTFGADKMVFRSALDVVNLTSIVVPSGVLKPNTMYFWRASVIDTGGDLSNPSPTAS
ncbi:MAG: hypothetical protein HY770_08855, partial [Chitinivibrionia bacterium]|nr:hypothetical protein [Chitinivibrionia bacterium]